MDKYYKIERYLKSKTENNFYLTFQEIEEILGFKLTPSAYKYNAWWSTTHPMADIVFECGYKMSANLTNLIVYFYKIKNNSNDHNIEKSSITNDRFNYNNSYNKTITKPNVITNYNYKTDIFKYVINFVFVYQQDDNSRYKSYDHIRSAFLKYRKDETKRNLITLHLYSYLASWGMLRNSFLMQKDYLFSRPVVDVLCKDKYDLLLNFNPLNKVSFEEIELIEDLAKEIRNCYISKSYYEEGSSKNKGIITNVTDTLVSKIILGTIGCTVAYDRYVKAGLIRENITPRLDSQSIMELNNFAIQNKDEIKLFIEKLGDLYTPMKIIDMYFFEKGFKVENN